MATSNFRYLPLETENPTFRLIRLCKGNTINIECEIFHSPISSSVTTVSYEALSYTWGSTDLVDYIQVNGRTLWITANLYSALLCLRSRDHDRILWIDAICIDQSNRMEQSQQVQMMGSIFSFADRVIFWLEKPTPEVMLLMESLSELQTRSIVLPSDSSNLDEMTLEKLWIQSTSEFRVGNSLARQRKGLQRLLEKPWFERVWILQEVANARSAVVCSGTLTVAAYIFAQAPSLLDISPSPHVRSVLDIMPQPSRRDSWWSQERERRLLNLLTRFHASKATDERDMIFALLGMSSEPTHSFLRPDYTKATEEVVHNAVRYWFESTDIPISQIIHALAAFETVRATYLVLPKGTVAPTEVIGISSQSGTSKFTIECIRNASLLKIEQYKEATGSEDTFHHEFDQLEAYIAQKTKITSLRIVPWQQSRQNLKFLIVEHAEEALLEISWTKKIFDFVVNEGTKNDRKLLDKTLSMTLISPRLEFDRGTRRRLIDRGADVNAQAGGIDGLFYRASEEGDDDLVRMLLGNGVNVNAQGGFWGNALQAASFAGKNKTVQILLEKGANVNAQGGKCFTALQTVSAAVWLPGRYNHDRIAQMLLEKGADVNAQGGQYGNALWAASYFGHYQIVRMLLDYGADVEARNSQASWGVTPYMASLWHAKNEKVTKILHEHEEKLKAREILSREPDAVKKE